VTLAEVADVACHEALGLRWALVRSLRVPPDEVAPVLYTALPGHRVVTFDDALVDGLVTLGGRVARRAHDYAYDLATVPASYAESTAPQGFRLSQDLDAVALAAVHDAALPPGHVDHEPGFDHLADVRAMLAGEILGPLVPEACWQVSDDEGPCGAVFVVDRPETQDMPRQAWVVDVFVHPRAQGRGAGGTLLRRALAGARAAGFDRLGLVVTDGNPARAAYEALGFTYGKSGTNVDIP
jgi:GNAT superfamily N-acetyltransferase